MKKKTAKKIVSLFCMLTILASTPVSAYIQHSSQQITENQPVSVGKSDEETTTTSEVDTSVSSTTAASNGNSEKTSAENTETNLNITSTTVTDTNQSSTAESDTTTVPAKTYVTETESETQPATEPTVPVITSEQYTTELITTTVPITDSDVTETTEETNTATSETTVYTIPSETETGTTMPSSTPYTTVTETVPTTVPVTTQPIINYKGSAGENLIYSFGEKTGVLTISGKGKVMNTYTAKNPAPWHTFADKIKKVDLSSAKSLTNISNYAFAGLVKLTQVVFSTKIESIGNSAFLNTKSLKNVVINKKVLNIYSKAFMYSGLTKITFLDSQTAIKGGDVTIPSTAKMQVFNSSKSYKYAVKYSKKYVLFVDKISFSTPRMIITKGKTYTMPVTVSPAKAKLKTLTWESSNKNIATVNKNGVVKAKSKGTCYITAKSTDGGGISSTKFRFMVTEFKIKEYMFTKNNCYKECTAIDPKGVVVHSTGVNNPYVSTYVPSWNVPKPGGREVCVHGFLGKDKNGKMVTYQVLPYEMACWGVGGGSKGSYNYYPGYIQFECCEDNLYNKSYFKQVYETATDYCAYLCLRYAFTYNNVVSHAESCKLGYGSNHGDIDHWLAKYKMTMKDFRKTVKQKIYAIDPNPDLKSGLKNKAVTVKSNTKVWSKDYADEYGTGSKAVATVKKGDTVYFIRDYFNGWSYVRTANGKKGYIRNDQINLSYTSVFDTKKAARYSLKVYTRAIEKEKYKGATLKYGAKVKLISSITAGTKKGWAQIMYNKKIYYVKYKYLM